MSFNQLIAALSVSKSLQKPRPVLIYKTAVKIGRAAAVVLASKSNFSRDLVAGIPDCMKIPVKYRVEIFPRKIVSPVFDTASQVFNTNISEIGRSGIRRSI